MLYISYIPYGTGHSVVAHTTVTASDGAGAFAGLAPLVLSVGACESRTALASVVPRIVVYEWHRPIRELTIAGIATLAVVEIL